MIRKTFSFLLEAVKHGSTYCMLENIFIRFLIKLSLQRRDIAEIKKKLFDWKKKYILL